MPHRAHAVSRVLGLAVALTLGPAGDARAHALLVETQRTGDAIIVTVGDPAGPRTDVGVTVIGPQDGGTTHQKGATDRRGRFVFLPDAPGEWQVVIDDGFGHRSVARVIVDSEGLGTIDKTDSGLAALGTLPRLLVGLSWIAGISGIAFYALARRDRTRRARARGERGP